MPTSTQYYNAMTQTSYLASGVNYWYELNGTQTARLHDAMRLWDDVSNFSAIAAVDDPNLARASTTYITEYFLGIPIRSYWENSLPNEWTRVAVGDIADPNTLGINRSYGDNGRYREVFIDVSTEGVSTFQLGSRANYTLLHELGHSIVGGHLSGDLTQTLMQPSASNDPSVWYPSTPMTLDIDQAAAMYGAATTTRTGNDVYGFNASFSDGYRAAFDFSVNTRPLVTIYDNGGYDTLDASGFYDGSFNPRSVVVNLGQGASSYLMGGQTFAVIYRTTWIEAAVSGGGSDYLYGNALNNSLTAGAGNDWILAQGGNDNVYGGTGTDTAVFSSDSLSYAYWINSDGTIGISGVDGNDSLDSIQRLQFANGTFELWQIGLDDGASDAATTRGLTLGLSTSGSVETKGDHDWFSVDLGAGATYRFSLNGSASNDGTLGDGYLTLRDWYGNPLQSDDDSGPGFDARLIYTASSSGSHFLDAYAYGDAQIGSYVISAVVRQSLTAANNSFAGTSGAEWILGLDGNDTLRGMAGDDLLDGGAGNDVFTGGEGDDDLIGGPGGDTYLFDADFDLGTDVLDESGGGIDTLDFSGTTTRSVAVNLASAGTQVANTALTLVLGSGTTFENLIGSALADTLTGNALANALTGGGGEDTLLGGVGNDTLKGGSGNDSVLGGDGDDALDGGSGNDSLVGGLGNDEYTVDAALDLITENTGEGVDKAFSKLASYTLAANVDNLALSGAGNQSGTGNILANTIVGQSGDNVILGMGGDDSLVGGGGDDNLDGGGLNDTLVGGSGNDSLFGGGGDDSLLGGAGNDSLKGGSGGIDTLKGGAGNDDYEGVDAADVLTEGANQGYDRVFSNVSFTLGNNFEYLELSSSSATTGTGNSLGNTLIGNSGNNILSGLGGPDVLYGRHGNDSLSAGVDAVEDQFVFDTTLNAATNVDTLFDAQFGEDQILLDNDIFGALLSNGATNEGTLASAYYFEGVGLNGNGLNSATGVWYNLTSGGLYYNPTANVAGDSILFAIVSGDSATPANTDFTLFTDVG